MDYVLVAQDRRHVEHFARQPDRRWILSEIDDDGEIGLPSIDCRLKLSDLYRKLELLRQSNP